MGPGEKVPSFFTGTHVPRAREGAVVTGTLVDTIEPLGAVCEGGREFSDDTPGGLGAGLPAKVTCGLNVLVNGAADFAGRKDLVVMVVENGKVGVGLGQKSVPVV